MGVAMFMFCIGASTVIKYNQQYNHNRNLMIIKRGFINFIKLGCFSMLITIITFIFIPDKYIYFGALHCLSLISILHIPFVLMNSPSLTFIIACCMIIYGKVFGLFPLEAPVGFETLDLMLWFNNLAYSLIGVSFAQYKIHQFLQKRINNDKYCLKDYFHENNVFCFLGRYSFLIYILHQAILFPIIIFIKNYIVG
jgi:uncharacterized membrane protein